MTAIACLSRCLRLVAAVVAGEIAPAKLRLALRPATVAVCRRQGGMLFCDRTTEKQFFGR